MNIVYRNDIRRMRRIMRPLYYRIQQFEFYRLRNQREQMIKHSYIDKEKVVEDKQKQNEDWVWVFHIKPTKIQKYSRFW